jgi:ferric-dicitrate binding protein FerR (iron transport regulator)
MRPDFDELVGTDLDPNERARLERVHELLVAAGPPPDAPTPAPVVAMRPRRRGALLALAAALAVAAFALGAALVDGTSSGRAVDYDVSMAGTDAAPDAAATIAVFEVDEAGNWPMELRVEGLSPAASGRPFELWLTRDGELAALCGAFATAQDGSAAVPLNAPYRFDDFDDWVVVERGSETPLLTT